MNQNRAMEFLCSAKGALPLLGGRGVKRAENYLNLAIDEVQELLDRIAELEGRDGRPALVIVTQDTEYRPSTKKRLQGFLGALEG